MHVKKEVPKIKTLNVSTKHYEQTYCILKSAWDNSSPTLSVHHDVLFRFGSWCYSGKACMSVSLALYVCAEVCIFGIQFLILCHTILKWLLTACLPVFLLLTTKWNTTTTTKYFHCYYCHYYYYYCYYYCLSTVNYYYHHHYYNHYCCY